MGAVFDPELRGNQQESRIKYLIYGIDIGDGLVYHGFFAETRNVEEYLSGFHIIEAFDVKGWSFEKVYLTQPHPRKWVRLGFYSEPMMPTWCTCPICKKPKGFNTNHDKCRRALKALGDTRTAAQKKATAKARTDSSLYSGRRLTGFLKSLG